MSAQTLYTPQLLALAVELADWPARPSFPLHGEARSRSCGSTLAMDLELDAAGNIAQLGMAVRACAIGQAAAAIYARHAAGHSLAEIETAHDAVASWLEMGGTLPNWPDIVMIAAARDYPGRHGAMLLPWKAALSGLSTSTSGQ